MPIYDLEEVLHRIRVKLYQSNLPQAQGRYLARTANEAELTIEDVAASAINRAGVHGNYHTFVTHIRQFLAELAYQLCDGFAVNTGYFTVYPVVKGLFEKTDSHYDRDKHSITFRFRVNAPLRKIVNNIVIELEGEADTGGRIYSFADSSGEVNGALTPGGLFCISGRKIKVTGDSPDCGVWFAREDGSERYKAAGRVSVNTGGTVCGMVPALPGGAYTIEVVTQYTIGGINLKKPRTVRSEFTVRAG